MRVAFVVQRYGAEVAGGAEALCRDTARALVRAGEDVTVFTTTARDYLSWEPFYPEGDWIDDGVRVRRFPVVQGRAPWWHATSRRPPGSRSALRWRWAASRMRRGV